MQGTQREPGTLKPLKNEEISKARGVSGADREGDQGSEVGEKWTWTPEGAPGKEGVVEERGEVRVEQAVSEDKPQPFAQGCCLPQSPSPELSN